MVALYVALIVNDRRTFVKADLEAIGLDENGNAIVE